MLFHMLPKDSAHIIQLKFKEQRSYKEIAQDTGFSESNVGYKLHHIIKDLSEELKGKDILNEQGAHEINEEGDRCFLAWRSG